MDESLMTSESISISEPFEEIDSSDVPEVSETLSGPSKKSTNVDAKKDGGDETVSTAESAEPGDDKTTEKPKDKGDAEDETVLDVFGNGQLVKSILLPGPKDAEMSRAQHGELMKLILSGPYVVHGNLEPVKDLPNVEMEFTLGDCEICQGIDLVLPLMKVGEEAEVHIAPRFAFGSLGMSEVNIPPDCKVMYFVKLLGVEREPDPQTLTPEERLSKGLHKKARGNFFYQRREFSSAVQCYRRALDYLDDNPETIGSSQTEGELLREQAEERIHVLFEERLKVENNLAVAQMNMEAYDGALSSLDRVLSCQPQNVKALFRKGKCLRLKGELDEAVQVLRRGLDVSPNEKPIQAELGLVLKKLKEENEKSKSMYQKMVGGMMNEGSSEEQKEDAKKKEKRGGWFSSIAAAVLVAGVAVAVGGLGFYLRNYSS